MGCLNLLDLPLEIRLIIWEQFTYSLHFYFPRPGWREIRRPPMFASPLIQLQGRRGCSGSESHIKRPEPPDTNDVNAFALLHTCKSIYMEVSPLVLRNATIHCNNTEWAVDFLMSLSEQQVRAVRHLEFYATPFKLELPKSTSNPHDDHHSTSDIQLRYINAMRLFKGLELETLTIKTDTDDIFRWPTFAIDRFREMKAYLEVYNSVWRGKGFRELRYIYPRAKFLSPHIWQCDWDENISCEPECWDRIIKERDGPNSGAEVKIWIANEGGEEVDLLDPARREQWVPGIDYRSRNYRLVRKSRPVYFQYETCYEDERKVMVVVRRGRNADVRENGEHLDPRIETLFKDKTWAEIVRSRLLAEVMRPNSQSGRF
jgi:hypothetical protein